MASSDSLQVLETRTVETIPFDGQKMGTSGLRKKVTVFQQPHYLENFVQSSFNAIEKPYGDEGDLKGSVLVVGGDGRFYMQTAIQTLLEMSFANGVGEVIVGRNGLLSTPAVSALIRRRKARGGFILTASHNPGGPTEDFGIKYNIANGGPAPESISAEILAQTTSIKSYKISNLPKIDLSKPAQFKFKDFTVTVVDSVTDYVELMKELFDFPKLKEYITSSNLKLKLDCMHGVAGPYATEIFVKELGTAADAVINNIPKEDFNGGHPDPNLTYAHDLVELMKGDSYDLGAAFDGDADRNMILGKNGFFVTPSDSVAVIAANYQTIPYLAKSGLKGLARSMPTGAALDLVAKKLNVEFFEVPTGWKFFGNLMDADRLSICGEESFGTGSNHVREKDGVWAVLSWLSILANRAMSVEQVLNDHWNVYGRNFFTRYDYEGVESDAAKTMMTNLGTCIQDPSTLDIDPLFSDKVKTMDNFAYTDATNGERTENQGLRIIFESGSRIIFRLSGTGSSGATIRLYVDSYYNDPKMYSESAQVALKPLVQAALRASNLGQLTGRTEPTVIT